MIKTLTDENYVTELKEHRISVVKVYANWCGPCRFMASHYKKWHKDDEEGVSFFEIENDANNGFVKEYSIEKLPSLVFFVHGVHVCTIQGMTRKAVFDECIQDALEVEVSDIPDLPDDI